jgi:hypothetical protein
MPDVVLRLDQRVGAHLEGRACERFLTPREFGERFSRAARRERPCGFDVPAWVTGRERR